MQEKICPIPCPILVQPKVQQSVTVVVPTEDLGFNEKNKRNKPQFNSAGVGAKIFMMAGINTAWAVGFRSVTITPVSMFIPIAFYFGGMIGALLGSGLWKTAKRNYFLFSAALTFVDGFFLLAASHNQDALMVAKYFDGVAAGLVMAPTLTLVGEESVKSMRGMLAASVEMMGFYLGVLLQICFATLWSFSNSSGKVLELQGAIGVIVGLITALMVHFSLVESPVHHLSHGQEEMAIDSLRRLQRPFLITTETHQILAEHKRYVATNKELSYKESFKRGLPAVGVLAIFRSLVALGFCTATYTSLTWLAEISGVDWKLLAYLFALLLSVGAIVPIYLVDKVGRRKPTLIGGIMCGLMALAFAINFDNLLNLSSSCRANTMLCLMGIYAFFVSFFTVSSSVYLSEAFPLLAKPAHISITFSVQMIVQIIVTCCFSSSIASFFYALMAHCFLFVVLAWFALPETKGLCLQDAQEKFNYFLIHSARDGLNERDAENKI